MRVALDTSQEDGILMSPATEQLLRAVLSLPEEERFELVEALLAPHDQSDELPFDQAWSGEIQRRSAEIETGMVRSTPWPVVREGVRQRLHGRSSD
jgi:putative addiction module component (TIGR02574 family)